MSLFQKSVLKKYVNDLNRKVVDEAYTKFKEHFGNPEIQKNIRDAKEEQYQEGFLNELFVKILGYTLNPLPKYNLITELKNEKDSKKADGAILKDDKAIAVIELKSTDTTDLSKIEVQAFNYKNNQKGCVYVITSNFEKLRFYIDDAIDHEDFNLFDLSSAQFDLMYLCLQKDNLLNNIPAQIKAASITEEKDITKRLYHDYSKFKNDLFENITILNPSYDKLLLFKKTQKLLDRFLFICFAEDKLLLTPNFTKNIVNDWRRLIELRAGGKLYDRFKLYFNDLDKGNHKEDIFAYNGGLFEPDEILDNINIEDELLASGVIALSTYNYETEVDVNILGHIFENSLNEIEEVQAKLEGKTVDKETTKRITDGVFYTPKYITKYIVESSIGELCKTKKEELKINDETFGFAKRKGAKKILLETADSYRKWLLQLTICDPACGSGAFLNQALDFLINEHKLLDELIAQLTGASIIFSNIENEILENNIYGVDLNDESVEIAKLSLWLRTAQKGRKLSSLNNNIKCGNSLISDPEIAGNKAFNWENEFPEVYKNGGFDVIIGNPPYGIFISEKEQQHFNTNFPLTSYKTNLYVLFIERMQQIFNKGVVHFIIPKSLLFNTYYEAIRKHLLETTEINEIYTITEKVFEDAEVGGSLLLKYTIKQNPNTENNIRLASANKVVQFIANSGIIENFNSQSYFLKIPNCEISITSKGSQSIIDKLHSFKNISNYYTLKNGLNPGNIKHILISKDKISEKHKPIIWGKDISKYNIVWSHEFINYDEKISVSLSDIKSKKGMKKQNKIDFALRTPELFEKKKIVVRKTGDSLIGCIDENNYYFDTLVHGIYETTQDFSLEYLLAIINSKPATLFYRLLHDIKGKVFAKISLDNLASFPIPKGDEVEMKSLKEKSLYLLSTVKKIDEVKLEFVSFIKNKFGIENTSLKLQNWNTISFKDFIKELAKAKVKLTAEAEFDFMNLFEKQKQIANSIQTTINNTNAEIDQMVFKLYGLTEEEIKIVEGKNS